MNMQSIISEPAVTANPLLCAHQLLVVALDLVDEMSLPGDIGAHLDHSIQLLGRQLGPSLAYIEQPSI